jgi:hypothetical protein
VQRLVVLAVDAHELVGALRVEEPHLLVQALPADRRHQHVVLDLALEHGARGMPHRGEDDPP